HGRRHDEAPERSAPVAARALEARPELLISSIAPLMEDRGVVEGALREGRLELPQLLRGGGALRLPQVPPTQPLVERLPGRVALLPALRPVSRVNPFAFRQL